MTTVEIQWTPGWQDKVNKPNVAAAVGIGVRNAAHSKAPEDTSALKKSLRWDTEDDSVEISANTYYALYVEKGTSQNPAQPYLQVSMKPGAEEALRTYKPKSTYARKAGKTLTAKEIEAKGRSTAVRDFNKQQAQSAMSKRRDARQAQANQLQSQQRRRPKQGGR